MQLISIIERLDDIIDNIEESEDIEDIEDFVKELRDLSSELFGFYKDNKLLLKGIKARTYDIN